MIGSDSGDVVACCKGLDVQFQLSMFRLLASHKLLRGNICDMTHEVEPVTSRMGSSWPIPGSLMHRSLDVGKAPQPASYHSSFLCLSNWWFSARILKSITKMPSPAA
jgi:hypothetical protein